MNKNTIDLKGMVFGNWKVVEYEKVDGKRGAYWLVECQCDKKTRRTVKGTDLRNGKSKSCGCSQFSSELKRQSAEPVIGVEFGDLTPRRVVAVCGGVNYYYCECSCGHGNAIVPARPLRDGAVSNCMNPRYHKGD